MSSVAAPRAAMVAGGTPAKKPTTTAATTMAGFVRLEAGLSAVGLARVEAHRYLYQAVAHRDLETGGPLERRAVLADVEQGARLLSRRRAHQDLGSQRKEIGGAVPVRAEEDLAALSAVELFVVADAM